jgi:hypothetical protein
MRKNQAGAGLIVLGVVAALAAIPNFVGSDGSVSIGGLGYWLAIGAVALLGAGVWLIAIDELMVPATLARRGLKILGLGLISDAVLFSVSTLPAFQGINVMILFFPVFAATWSIVIGAVITTLTLLKAGGRPRWIGVAFVAAPVAFFAGNTLTYKIAGSGGAPVGVALNVVAGVAVLIGFVGLAWLSIRPAAFERQPRQES